jgi:hypothetical protein
MAAEPVRCAKCGRAIVYRARRFAWVHLSPPRDNHAPAIPQRSDR